MIHKPLSFSIALVLILLNALFWLGFGVLMAANLHPAPPVAESLRWTLAGLALSASLFLLVMDLFLFKRSRLAYYLAMAVLVTLILLTFTDDFGLADLAYLVLTAIPLALLINIRKWYFAPREINPGDETGT